MKPITKIRKKFNAADWDPRTVEAMNNLIDSIEKNFDEWDPAIESSLQLLAYNYDLLFQAVDEIRNNGTTSPDGRKRLQRNPAITLFLNTQNAIQSILTKTGLTVVSKVKVQKYMKDSDPEELDDFEKNFLED
jgi:phage terminase small subunit